MVDEFRETLPLTQNLNVNAQSDPTMKLKNAKKRASTICSMKDYGVGVFSLLCSRKKNVQPKRKYLITCLFQKFLPLPPPFLFLELSGLKFSLPSPKNLLLSRSSKENLYRNENRV